MKDLILKIPGKSFLAGEYLALHGGPNLVVATKPTFEIRISEKKPGQTKTPTFHPQSPAGKFFFEYHDFFEQFSFQWTNHYGVGGFGASTAEFIGLHALYQMRDSLWIEQERHFDLHEMLKAYRDFAKDPESKWTPSGADLVAQVRGGITFMESRSGHLKTFAWPFENIGFALVRTGNKIPTHEHLKNLQDFDSQGLESSTLEMVEAIQNLNEGAWIQSVQSLAQELQRLGFVHEHSQKLLEKIRKLNVQAAKGCGALGADVLAVFYEKSREAEIAVKLLELDLPTVATDRELSEGLSVFVESKARELL